MMVSNGVQRGQAGRTRERVRILLVDDDRSWARTARRRLAGNEGVAIDCVRSLAEARDAFERLDPDCVISGARLPDGTGLGLLETVREVDPDRPFVLVTGPGNERLVGEAIERGVTETVRKDADAAGELLERRVEHAVRIERAERALARARHGKEFLADAVSSTGSDPVLEECCHTLVEEFGYACAWIGTAGADAFVRPAASAGADDHLETLSITGTTDGATADHPAALALDRDEPVVRGKLGTDRENGRPMTDHDGRAPTDRGGRALPHEDGSARAPSKPEGWPTAPVEDGIGSVAAVPIAHEAGRPGVLVVEGRSSTIDPAERRALREFATTIGAVVDRAGWSKPTPDTRDESIAIDVADPNVPLVALAEAVAGAGRIEVSAAVDRGDGTLYLARVPDVDVGSIEASAAAVDGLELQSVSEGDGRVRCALVADDPTPEHLLVDHGGRVAETVVEDGVATVVGTVPEEAVDAVASDLEAEYGPAAVSTTGSDGPTVSTDGREGSPAGCETGHLAALTERQRDVIEFAFHAGYFENPRGVSATELAERFDIARATLTQHLRTAERKVLSDVLTE